LPVQPTFPLDDFGQCVYTGEHRKATEQPTILFALLQQKRGMFDKDDSGARTLPTCG
jgi:hypothetical protein